MTLTNSIWSVSFYCTHNFYHFLFCKRERWEICRECCSIPISIPSLKKKEEKGGGGGGGGGGRGGGGGGGRGGKGK